MTTSLTEPKHPGEFITNEWDKNASREVGTVKSGQKMIDGTVVELSSGKLQAKSATVNTAGAFTVAVEGILIGNWDASATGTNADIANVPYVKRGPIVVNDAALTHPTGQEAASRLALKALGIIPLV